MLEKTLYYFGYGLAHLLFIGARTPKEVVRRLRFAYRLVGVRIKDRSTEGSTERTVFLCPYRNVLAGRYGKRWVCHEKLDRVDDGYVTYLKRKRDIDYERPRACPASESNSDSEYCFSEVSELET